jgi:hypothetical protein
MKKDLGLVPHFYEGLTLLGSDLSWSNCYNVKSERQEGAEIDKDSLHIQ